MHCIIVMKYQFLEILESLHLAYHVGYTLVKTLTHGHIVIIVRTEREVKGKCD